MMRSRRDLLTTAAGLSLLTGCLGGGGDGTNDAETGTPTPGGDGTGGAETRTPTAGGDGAGRTATASDDGTGGTGTPTPGADKPDPDVEGVSLLLNWKPNGLHVPYYTATARGFYEDRGLPVSEIKAGEGSDFSAKQVGLGNEAFGVTSSDQVVNINSRDVSVLTVGVMMQKSPVVVFSTEEVLGEPLESVEQLRGKTVGTGPGMVEVLTKVLLRREDVFDSVTMTSTGFDTVQKLLSGDVDAAGGVFGDAIAAEHEGYTTHSIPVAETVPSYGHVLATSPSFAEENPDAVRAFLQGTAKGAAWAMNNPGEGVDHLVEANPSLAESRAQTRDNWDRMAEGFMLSEAVTEEAWGWSRSTPWETTHQALDDADLLDGSVDPASVWTNEYLDGRYRYLDSFHEVVSDS